jgi:hypothetical protein
MLALSILAIAGCGGETQTVTPKPGLSALLVDTAAPGFSPRGSGSGPMDLETAANSTEASVDSTRKALKNSTFGGGHVKVWTNGSQYIVALVMAFDNAVDASRFADFEVNYLKGTISASVYSDQFLPGVTDFTLNGATRNKATVFCQGMWFTVEADAFNTYLCDTERPVSAAVAGSFGTTQYRRALTTLLAPTPGASPGAARSPSPTP